MRLRGREDQVPDQPAGSTGVVDQKFALAALKAGRSAFVTGPPGAGKSWLIRKFMDDMKGKKQITGTASTGIAATHINGRTLHSWAGLGTKQQFDRDDIQDIARKPWIRDQVLETDVLVIDEVSMLGVTTFEAADLVCRVVRRNNQPFGGLQVILCGDFFQLPPVSRSGVAPFIYGCRSWQAMNPDVLYLNGQFRQKDSRLTDILGAIRSGEVSLEQRELLRHRLHAPLRKARWRLGCTPITSTSITKTTTSSPSCPAGKRSSRWNRLATNKRWPT